MATGLAARKGEKLLGQRRRALGAADRRLDLLPAVLGGDGLAAHQPTTGVIEATQDDLKQIVEIVRDPAGELA